MISVQQGCSIEDGRQKGPVPRSRMPFNLHEARQSFLLSVVGPRNGYGPTAGLLGFEADVETSAERGRNGWKAAVQVLRA